MSYLSSRRLAGNTFLALGTSALGCCPCYFTYIESVPTSEFEATTDIRQAPGHEHVIGQRTSQYGHKATFPGVRGTSQALSDIPRKGERPRRAVAN